MAWLYLTINGVLSAFAAWFGWRSRRFEVRRCAAFFIAAALLMALRTYLHAHPEYEQYLLGLSDNYVYFTGWEVPLVVFMLFALGSRLETQRVRRLLFLSLGMCAPLFLWDSVALCVRPDYTMPAQVDRDGVCLQATDYSCGPAAGATLLRALGTDATEAEMAELCLLKPGQGVTALELCRGLNIALRAVERRAAIRHLATNEPDLLPVPFLAELERPGTRTHCVVVLAVLDDCAILADPARGQYVQKRSEFEREWTGLAITAEPLGR